jgi:hypothetical protein
MKLAITRNSDYDPARTERLLLGIPVAVTCALGLVLGLTRFVLVLKESLIQPPASWGAMVLLLVLVGSAAIVIVLVAALAGLLLGAMLAAIFRRSRSRHFLRRSAAHL